jgi:hypothetical protein
LSYPGETIDPQYPLTNMRLPAMQLRSQALDTLRTF